MAKRARSSRTTKEKSGISTTEIVIGIVVVIVIFSLIGILNMRPVAEELAEKLEVNHGPDASVSGDSGSVVPVLQPPGTVLSQSDMEFQVVPQ